MKNILISGGAGFIGSNLCQKLLQLGYNVTVLDNLSHQVHGYNPKKTSPLYKSINGKVNFIKGSVENRKDWMSALTNQDAVIHLAAETGTGQSMYKIKKYVSVNIGGTAMLLDILTNEKHSIKKVIVASSRAIYGEGKYFCEKDGNVYPHDRKQHDMQNSDYECKCPICNGSIRLLATDEESRIQPKSVYAITKHSQEQMVLTIGVALGIPAVAFRYQNVYGPGQSLSNPYTGILSIFSTQIKNGNNINVFEDGNESRDFVYIDDVVNATILGLRNDKANFNVFNVGSGKPIDVIAISNFLRSKYDSGIEINISGNYRLGDIRHNYADLSKIKSFLGFTPEFDFASGLNNFCDWVNSQEIQNDKYQDSINEMKKKGFYR
jgi:dTDP-L-rhamnose 4-epimerase